MRGLFREMITPNPRGFPANTFPSADTWRGGPSSRKKYPVEAESYDPAELLTAARRLARRQAERSKPRLRELPPQVARATFALTFDETKLMLPTGKLILRKKGRHAGKLLKEVTPVTIQNAIVTVSYSGGAIFFRSSDRGSQIFDSRDKSRKPLDSIRPDLERMELPADKILAHLNSVIALGVRRRIERAAEKAAAPIAEKIVIPQRGLKLIPRAKRRQLLDPLTDTDAVLGYLSRQMTELPASMR